MEKTTFISQQMNKTPGQIAYEAWLGVMGVERVVSFGYTRWEGLAEVNREGWEAAARAIEEGFGRQRERIVDLEMERDALVFTNNQADGECVRLRALCAMVAGVLGDEFGDETDPDYGHRGPVHELIRELREAAQ